MLLVASLFVPATVAAPERPDDLNALARRAVELTNDERVRAGMTPLRWNEQLAAAATAYAQEMAAKGFFAHNSPDGTNPVDRARKASYPAYGWGGVYVGENLARGYNTAESVHLAWMASESHKQNLLHPQYREIGIGIAVAPNGTRYWAQEFGSRPMALPVFINDDANATESPAVNLTLTEEQVSAWGSLSTITGVMVSNRPDFADAGWEPFARTKSWMLQTRPGPQAVYVRVRDAAGRIAEASDEIQFVGRVALTTGEPLPMDGEVAGEPAPAAESGE